MSKATCTKFKFFFADQDVEQEQWLRAMALQGLHLKKLNLLQMWTFVKGEPADMVYRVDFNNEWQKPDYRQLLEDAGWERAAHLTGWQYWRTKAVNGRSPELFTDVKSKSAKFNRLIVTLVVACLPGAILFSSPTFSWPFRVLFGAALAVVAIAFVRLLVRLWRVRQVA